MYGPVEVSVDEVPVLAAGIVGVVAPGVDGRAEGKGLLGLHHLSNNEHGQSLTLQLPARFMSSYGTVLALRTLSTSAPSVNECNDVR